MTSTPGMAQRVRARPVLNGVPSSDAGGWWHEASVRAGQAVAGLSRRIGRGGGSIIGGRVTLWLQSGALRTLATGRQIVLVSGTNGKTTTSHMLAAALRTLGPVAHNAAGSNMADGVVAALAQHREAGVAVLEVDELHLASVARQCNPAAIVLLNLTRDQLDRATEVRSTATAIGSALAGLPTTTVFANADDPMTVWAVRQAAGPVTWVAAGSGWQEDSLGCPQCGGLFAERLGRWSCGCGLVRPDASWWLDGALARGPGSVTELSVDLPGAVNRTNALLALAVADAMGVFLPEASRSISGIRSVSGRYAIARRGLRDVRLLLAKNPAGWAATLSMIELARPLLILVNAREADGRDTSWLWDVDFAPLAGRPIIAAGERAADLGVRLSYADLAHRTEPDPIAALDLLPEGMVDVVANYTAFQQLSNRLSGEPCLSARPA